jgi:hypothetical protein
MSTDYSASSGPSERKSFLLRLDPAIHDALARWADDELRSTSGQIEFLLRRALDSRTEHLSDTRQVLALPHVGSVPYGADVIPLAVLQRRLRFRGPGRGTCRV